MIEEEYKNLQIDDLVYNNNLKMLRRISSQLSNPEADVPEGHCFWTNDLSGEYLAGSEGLKFSDKEDWNAIKYQHTIPDWVKIELLEIRISRLENALASIGNYL
jgi:hypothetical protein